MTMSFNWDLRVPYAYRSNTISLRELEQRLLVHMPRAAVRRHLALLHSREGRLGVGSAWRVCPHPVSTASQNCQSFHQDQKFADGEEGGVAIDYVWVDGADSNDWHDGVPTGGVPIQGTPEAKKFGIHANVGTPGTRGFESWHGQPVEVDGWGSATGNGAHPAPAIDPNYPLPPEHDPYATDTGIPPVPPTQENDMHVLDTPIRILDTRRSGQGGSFKAGEVRDIVVSTDGDATAVFVNVTIVNATEPGHLTMYGGTSDKRPNVSNLNWDQPGEVIANSAWVPTHNDHIHVWTHSACDVIIDLQAVQS